MVLQRVEVAVRDGQEPAFEAALCEVRQRVFQGVERPSAYLVQVIWETAEELLDFGESGRFERCWTPVEPFVAGPIRPDHFVEHPGLALNGPGVITDLAWLTDQP